MNNFRTFLVILAMSSTSVLLASEDVMTIAQKLGSLKLEKLQAEAIVATMVKRGHLDHKEANRIKREIASVKEEDTETIKAEALEHFKTKNSIANK